LRAAGTTLTHSAISPTRLCSSTT